MFKYVPLVFKSTKIIPDPKKVRNNLSKYNSLRKQFPHFNYRSYHYSYNDNQLIIRFEFEVPDSIVFTPEINISWKNTLFRNRDEISAGLMDNLVFHLGMIEMVSYWKATCSPVIILPEKKLSRAMARFWEKLFFNGLGEFFYVNNIETHRNSFMTLRGLGTRDAKPVTLHLEDRPLVPVGGGKDSVATISMLSNAEIDWIPFVINPKKATRDVLSVASKSLTESVLVERQIDPRLLELNKTGYLNGHTPFSAVVAFYSLLGAFLTGSSEIILSNESSANEPTIPGTTINHQYSKTYEFEKDFREYVNRFISPSFNYFSLLRPLTEMQIAQVFAENPKYFPHFLSCNPGSKSGKWCGKCPKCLFTWIILSPFISQSKLQKIFGKDLLNDKELLSVLEELSGISTHKPFECIGTVEEVNASLHHLIRNYRQDEMPPLLKHYLSSKPNTGYLKKSVDRHLTEWDPNHFVPDNYIPLIRHEEID
jgi:hypothetical protein